jgi:hypothetical protein
MKSSVLALLIMASVSMACGGNSSTTPATTASSSGSFNTFSSLLDVQGSIFYSFTVTTAGTVSLSLASLSAANTAGPASTSVVRLGLGVPLGTGCSVTSSVDTTAGLTTQLTVPVSPDIYCVNISDIGNLTTPMNFTIRIGQNVASSSSSAAAASSAFASFLSFGGSSTHTFTISQGGTISLTLTNVTPPVPIGMGIGIPGASATTCSLTSSLTTPAGSTPQITIPVDSGTYCVEAYDAGAVVGPGVAFSITIVHP